VKTFLFLRGDDRTPDKTPLPPGVPEGLGGRFGRIEPVNLPLTAHSPEKRPFVVAETLAASANNLTKARKALDAARPNVMNALVPVLASGPPAGPVLGAAAQNALDAWSVAELDASLAEVKHAALLSVLEAEKLEDGGKKDSEEWKQAATAAATSQKKAAVLEARRNLLAARQAVGVVPEKMRAAAVKKVADTEAALAKAEAGAKQPATTAYTKRAANAYPPVSTGRRLAFARWVADRDNPLTARVAVNHVWLRHFGQALVPTVFDFGRNGQPPSHPALLDWLAAEFMERGWSMKALHRLIVTSSTYRQASTPDDANLGLDRDNQYLWRMNSRRVEAEVVRDCVFYVAGRLDLTTGGPDLDHNQGLTVPRRSVYFRCAPEKQMEFLKIFDGPSVNECYQRKESVAPQQALALFNSELALRHARLLARNLAAKAGAEAFTTAAFEAVLSRPPTEAERAECVTFLKERTRRYTEDGPAAPAAADPDGRSPSPDPALRAREALVHVLLNHNDFVTVR
jgi:hypothetical protein